MSGKLKFNKNYFILAVIIFFTEVVIALFFDDKFIRPYFGDFLVVILIYCFLRSFLDISVIRIALFSLLFSYLVEILQFFNIVGKLGLQNSRLATTVLGSSFEWSDMVAYTMGIALVLYVEKVIAGKFSQRDPVRK